MILFAVAAFGANEASLKPRIPDTKPSRQTMKAERYNNVARLKLVEGSQVRLRNGKLHVDVENLGKGDLDRLARTGLDPALLPAQLARLNGTLARYGVVVHRRFSRPEEDLTREQKEGEGLSGNELADLNLYYNLVFERGSVEDMLDALVDLNELPIVESARPALDAALTADKPPTTPNFEDDQTYLGSSPLGLGITSVWDLPGGRGQNMRFSDVEWGWRTANHEDLPVMASVAGFNNSQETTIAHSTAVRGILNAFANGYGVTGIARDATVYGSSPGDQSHNEGVDIAAAINTAASQIQAGDVILIEIAHSLPGTPPVQVPVEYEQGVYDSIATAVANLRIVAEGAGNRNQDLDQINKEGVFIFRRSVRDSGAILVGAGTPDVQHNRWVATVSAGSNYGSRVDIQGWGRDIATTGWCLESNPQHPEMPCAFPTNGDPEQSYSLKFSGTSGATAMISGAAGVINGIRKARNLTLYTSTQMRAALATVGSVPQGDPQNGAVGPFPNVAAVIDSLSPPSPVTTATGSAASVVLTWPAVTGATDYRVYRATSGAQPLVWSLRGTTSALTFTDSGVTTGTTYLYSVRSRDAGGVESAGPVFPDLATTINFTDVSSSDAMLAAYMVELRTASNSLCTFAGALCQTTPFSGADLDVPLVRQQYLLAAYFNDVSTRATNIRSAVGAKAEAWQATQPAHGNEIRKQHVIDLRRMVN